MGNYKVEMAEIRKKRGKDFLHMKILDRMVGFFEEEDVGVEVKEGDIISCKITKEGKFLNGTGLQVIDENSADLAIDHELQVERRPEGDGSKLHAGSRIYHFEVKTSSRRDKYLVITEQSGQKRNRIFVFDDHAEDFSQALEKNLQKLKQK